MKDFSKLGALMLMGASIGCSKLPPKIHYPGEDLETRLAESAEKNDSSDKYAVLISGDNRIRDLNDLSYSYQVLLEHGFKKKNVYIFDSDGKERFIYPVDGDSSKKNIKKVFSHLAKKVDKKDLLYVGITDHGDSSKNHSWVSLPGDDLSEKELKSYLDKIDSKVTIVLADICYGGGFAELFSTGNYVGISPARAGKLAYGDKEDTFTRHLMSGFRNPQESDLNGNGKVSLFEAFVYGINNDPWVKSGDHQPMIRTSLDLSKIYL